MGAAIHLVMGKGEKKRLLDSLKDKALQIGEYIGCIIGDAGGNTIKIEYQSSAYCNDLALTVAQQICKKYTVLRGGWDSVARLESVDKFRKYRAFNVDIDRAQRLYRSYKVKYPDIADVQRRDLLQFRKLRKEYEIFVKEII